MTQRRLFPFAPAAALCLALGLGMVSTPTTAQVGPTAAEATQYKGLQAAAHRGDASQIARLIAAGADPNSRDGHGRTPVHVATFARQRDAIRALAKAGADLQLLENDRYDAVTIAARFQAAGCDLIDVSSGQTTRDAKPVYGRMYQTPFADRIRNEVGIATMAVGAIFEADHVNGIIAAGRADLCAIARPHLANPAWTLTEVARLGYEAVDWPKPYLPGKLQLERNLARERQLAAANAGLTPQQIAARLLEA